MVYKYEWSGYSYKVPAETVGSICEEIEKRDGCVTNASLLDEARESSSPIHSLYEWDDNIAGEKWRLHQSSKILSSLKLTMESNDQKTVRAFINTNPVDSEGAFQMTLKAIQKAETRESILRRAFREFDVMKQKYNTLTELSSVWDAVEGVKNELAIQQYES